MFRIVKLLSNLFLVVVWDCLVFFAEYDLIEKLLSDNYYLFIFGALECNTPLKSKTHHLDDPSTKGKIDVPHR